MEVRYGNLMGIVCSIMPCEKGEVEITLHTRANRNTSKLEMDAETKCSKD